MRCVWVSFRQSIGYFFGIWFFFLCCANPIRCMCCACSCIFHNDDFELQFYKWKPSMFDRPNIVPFEHSEERANNIQIKRQHQQHTHTHTHWRIEIPCINEYGLAQCILSGCVAVVCSNLTTKLSNLLSIETNYIEIDVNDIFPIHKNFTGVCFFFGYIFPIIFHWPLFIWCIWIMSNFIIDIIDIVDIFLVLAHKFNIVINTMVFEFSRKHFYVLICVSVGREKEGACDCKTIETKTSIGKGKKRTEPN